MKNFIILAGMVMIMPCHTGCRTNKFSSRQQDQSAMFEQTDTRKLEQENIQQSRSLAVTDSSGQEYRITIFPTESFQLSPTRGFIGKASKIELSGSIRRINRMNDSTALTISGKRESKTSQISKQNSKQVSNSKSIEKTKPAWWVLGLVAVVLLFLTKIRLR